MTGAPNRVGTESCEEDQEHAAPSEREKRSSADERKHPIEPVPEKIPEGPDNLQRRREWFRSRSGGKE
jgi:hypothetical protein